MKLVFRTLMLMAVLVIPAAASAQLFPPPPPPAPAPTIAPMPIPAPAPMIAPMPIPPLAPLAPLAPMVGDLAWPGFPHELAVEAVLADAQSVAVQAQEAREAGRLAAEQARAAMETARVAWDTQSAYTLTSSNNAYDMGLQLMSRRDYEKAIVRFDQVVAAKEARVDGALYHKAYALFRLGRNSDATNTLSELRKSHPQSRYLKDAAALDSAIRQSGGQPMSPESADDEELKLLAINALVHTDPERALPLLEGVINGGANSLPLKIRALFVLAQSPQPRAREILMGLARGNGNPDLQRSAIQWLSSRGRERVTSAELKQIYDSTSDPDIKRAVIAAWGTMGDMGHLAAVVSGNADLALRTTALNRMSDPTAADTLWAIYQKEQNRDLRMNILSRLGSLGATDRLMDVVRTERDAEIRRRAIRSLGNMRADKSGAALADLYGREQDVENKKAIVTALASQQNGEALVAIARKESNMTLKREIVSRLSNMTRNKAAMDYMLEIIK